MDVVGNVLADSRGGRYPWAGATILAFLLHAAVLGGLLASAFAKPMHFAPPRAVAVRLLPAGAIRAPEVRTAPQPPAPPAAPKPKIEKPPEDQPPPPSKQALLLPAPDKKKAPPTPVPVSRPGRAATPAIDLPASGENAAGPPGPAPGAGGTAPTSFRGVQLDQKDFDYPIYLQGMVDAIGLNWLKPVQDVRTNPVVHFVIERDGTISDARLVTSSGFPFVDRAALRAVLASSPLPPLPAGYPGPHLGIQVVFE